MLVNSRTKKTRRRTSKGEMETGKNPGTEHDGAKALPNHAETERNDKKKEERQGVAPGVENGHHNQKSSSRHSSPMSINISVVP